MPTGFGIDALYDINVEDDKQGGGVPTVECDQWKRH